MPITSIVAPLMGQGRSGGRSPKIALVVASIADTGTITTGLTSCTGAVVCHNASTTVGAGASAFNATVTSNSGGVVTVTIVSFTTGSAIAAYAVAAAVACIAWGY